MEFLKHLKTTEDKSRQPVNEPEFEKEVIFKGKELVGLEYEPVFDFFEGKIANAHKVLDGDFVTTEDGTGIVHIASGFGEDDFNLCKKNGIGVACPVDDGGCFDKNSKDLHEIKYKLGDKDEVLELRGKQVFETNDDIIKYLKGKDLWVKTEQYLHNYPHCWRTDTPLIYKAVSSWYVKVSDFKDRMCELNKQIRWIPEHIRDGQFGKWLENARDWSITRNRFWGAPVPVWRINKTIFNPKHTYLEIDLTKNDYKNSDYNHFLSYAEKCFANGF
ncbi:MAG: class I tRNA ligase family protein, partial [Rickettsiales bacterium]|nr:class I tRNA ligase family protein [Rickettsiales bacterium]